MQTAQPLAATILVEVTDGMTLAEAETQSLASQSQLIFPIY